MTREQFDLIVQIADKFTGYGPDYAKEREAILAAKDHFWITTVEDVESELTSSEGL